jgi:hypothetical protein
MIPVTMMVMKVLRVLVSRVDTSEEKSTIRAAVENFLIKTAFRKKIYQSWQGGGRVGFGNFEEEMEEEISSMRKVIDVVFINLGFGDSEMKTMTWLERLKAAGTGTVVAVYAGVFEEVAFRWFLQPAAMAVARLSILVCNPGDAVIHMLTGSTTQMGSLGFRALGYVLNCLSFGMIDEAVMMLGPDVDPVYFYGVYIVDLAFSLAHAHQGPIGIITKPIGCAIMRKFTYAYGLPAGILSHVMWDWVLMAGFHVCMLVMIPFARAKEGLLGQGGVDKKLKAE